METIGVHDVDVVQGFDITRRYKDVSALLHASTADEEHDYLLPGMTSNSSKWSLIYALSTKPLSTQ